MSICLFSMHKGAKTPDLWEVATGEVFFVLFFSSGQVKHSEDFPAVLTTHQRMTSFFGSQPSCASKIFKNAIPHSRERRRHLQVCLIHLQVRLHGQTWLHWKLPLGIHIGACKPLINVIVHVTHPAPLQQSLHLSQTRLHQDQRNPQTGNINILPQGPCIFVMTL